MRIPKALLFLLLFAGVAYGQTTTVTLQVTDAGAQTWNNGTYTVKLLSTAGGVPPQTFYLGSTAMTAAQVLQTGSLNGSGGATLTLGQTVAIAPVTTTWQYVVCPQATAACYTASQTAVGSTQTVTLTPTAISVPPGNTNLVYSTAEVSNPQVGSTVYLIGTGLQTCTAVTGPSCTAWNGGSSNGGNNGNAFASNGVVLVPPPQAAGYKLVWQDNFTLPLDVCASNANCNWYTPGTPLWGATGYLPSSGIITNPNGTYVNLNWVLGQTPVQVTSMSTLSLNNAYYHAWQYGYFETSMAFNASTGSWPGFWMMPLSSTNDGIGIQDGGEVDILEWQSNTPTVFYGSVHAWNKGTLFNSNGISPSPAGVNFNQYNLYGLLWTPTQLCWYMNNSLQGCQNTTTSPWTDVFNGFGPYVILFDQAAGCNFINNTVMACPGQVSPLNMQVQWVRVYQSPSQLNTVAEPVISSPTITGNPPNLGYYNSSSTALTWTDTTSGATIYTCYSSGATCTPSSLGTSQTMNVSGSYCANGQLNGYNTSATVCVNATIGGTAPPSIGTNCFYFVPNVSTMACTLTASAGDLLIVFADDLAAPTSGTVSSVVDSGGATSVPIYNIATAPGSVAYYFANVSSGSHTITVNLSNSVSDPLLQVIDIHGAPTSNPIDTSVTNAQTTDTTGVSSGSLTTTAANELLLGHTMGYGQGVPVQAAPTFSLIEGAGTTLYSGYFVANAAGSYTFNATSQYSIPWSTAMMAIKP
jgi:beta-glucanase (GH16 family)